MPKTEIDYSKTIIYKIVCNDLNVTDIYIGHTTNFKERKRNHYNAVKNDIKYNCKLYQTIRENGGWNNWSMIELEKFYCCRDRNEAVARERFYYETLNANLNSQVPTRTKAEYMATHKEEKSLYDSVRRTKLHDIINEPHVCVCGGKYTSKHKTTHLKTSKHKTWISSQSVCG